LSNRSEQVEDKPSVGGCGINEVLLNAFEMDSLLFKILDEFGQV